MRGVDSFLKGMPLASMHAMLSGLDSAGGSEVHQVIIHDKLMDSESLFLTANTSTLYLWAVLDLHRDGPTVIDTPPGMLCLINDAAFDYLGDIGPAGPDKGKGGKFLVLPPDYEGDVPEGYFVIQAKSYRHWVLLRASIADGVDKAAMLIKDNLKMYPLSRKDNLRRGK
jgi:hypothetical protein